MKTINVSDKAYRRMLKQKRDMEEERGRLVFVPEVVDVLMGVKEDE